MGVQIFPYSTSSIQEFGFNPITGKIYNPAQTHDLMSYCPGGGSRQGWISPFTWNKMFNGLATTALNAAAASPDQPNVGILYETAASQSLMVSATIFNPDLSPQGGGKLGDLVRADGGLAYDVPQGEYAFELRKAAQCWLKRASPSASAASTPAMAARILKGLPATNPPSRLNRRLRQTSRSSCPGWPARIRSHLSTKGRCWTSAASAPTC